MQLEEQPPDNRPGAILTGATPLLRDVAHEGAREALERLHDAHGRYEEHVTSHSRDTLRGAVETAKAWVTTLTAVEQVGPGLGPMMGPSASAPARASVVGVREVPARKLPNLTAARALRALEVVVFHAASPPGLAATMGIHDRTARRLLQTLDDEGYLQRGHGNYRQRHTYLPTARLLALAGQLAARLPLGAHSANAVDRLTRSTGLGAYLVVAGGAGQLVDGGGKDTVAQVVLVADAAGAGGEHTSCSFAALLGVDHLAGDDDNQDCDG
jgi:hypothetical protein